MTRFLVLCLLFLQTPLISQRNLPDPADIALAQEMSKTYPDEEVASINYLIDVTFDYNKEKDLVTVTVKTNETLIGLRPKLDFTMAEFYNDQSEVEEIEVLNKKGKKVILDIKRENYTSAGIFYDDAKVAYFEVDFPTIGTCNIVQITKTYKDVRYFVSEYLSAHYPRKKSTLRFTVPAWLNVDFKEFNFDDVNKKISEDPKTGDKVYVFGAENVAPQAKEDYGKGPSHLYPHVLFLYQGYDIKGKSDRGFKEAKDLYKWYRQLAADIGNDRAIVVKKAEELTKNALTDEEKIKAIYYWVQENIRYIAFEDGVAGFRPDNCQNVFNNKYGDCKGMANLTKEMLNSLGMDARLVWIGTKRLAYDYTSPSLGVDNHMICAVKSGDGFLFLDATEEFNELGHYAEGIQGRPIMIEDGETFISAKIPVESHTGNTTKKYQDLAIEDEKLVGKATLEMEGESKADLLYQVNNLRQNYKDDAMRRYLDNGDKTCQVSNISSSDLTNRDGNITITYDFAWSNGISVFGDELYLDIDFEKDFKDLVFDKRKTDYLFDHKIHRVSEIKVAVPEGWQVVSIPEGFVREHEDFFFKIDYSLQNEKVLFTKEIGIPNSEIKAQDFATWNGFVKDLAKQYQEQIVLKKKP